MFVDVARGRILQLYELWVWELVCTLCACRKRFASVKSKNQFVLSTKNT